MIFTVIKYLCYFIFLFLLNNLHAKEIKKNREKFPPKISIAVLNIRSIHSPSSLAEAVTEITGEFFFKSKLFTLYEKTQMELIARKHGFDKLKNLDENKAAELGKIIIVQKMVIGSLSKINDVFRIEIRVVNVATADVDISITKKTKSPSDFEEIIDGIVQKIESHYLGQSDISGIFDLTVTGAFMYGIGDFSEGAGNGFGTSLNFSLNNPFDIELPLIFNLSFYSFLPKVDSIKSINMINASLLMGYKFRISRNLRFLPSAGCGYIITRGEYDNSDRGSAPYVYKKKVFYNPVLVFHGEFYILLYHSWFFTIIPEYFIFFESERAGQFTGIEAGIRKLF